MDNEMYECRVWLFEEDDNRLRKLMKELGHSKSAVIREALKMYEKKVARDESDENL